MIEARLTLPRRGFALDLALALPSRGVSALFGPSGCGKTTVLRALAGLERAAGRVVVDSEVWQDDASRRFVPTHRRPIGYVIQESVLFPHLDVRGNLAFASRRSARDRRPRIALDQAIGLLGIEPLLARRPVTLSGGERQRVAIARALASDPQLLLMDEPLAALDAPRKAELLPYLDRLHDELGLPIVYVSHALDEVARLADHLVLMEAGGVRAAGPVAELLARLDLPLARIDEAGVVLDGIVGAHDAAWQLARLDVAGGPAAAAASGGEGRVAANAAGVVPILASFWARDQGLPLGRRVRLRVLARDVSLSRQPAPDSSIANQLPATVEVVADDAHPALALVRLRIGAAVPVVARLTRRSAHALGLAPGASVWAHVKTVALME